MSGLSVAIVIAVIGVTTEMGGRTIVAVMIATVAVMTTDETEIVAATMTEGETVTGIAVAVVAAAAEVIAKVRGDIVAAGAAVETKTNVRVIEVAIAPCHQLSRSCYTLVISISIFVYKYFTAVVEFCLTLVWVNQLECRILQKKMPVKYYYRRFRMT